MSDEATGAPAGTERVAPACNGSEATFRELDALGIEYVVLRGADSLEGSEATEPRVLVGAGGNAVVDRVAPRLRAVETLAYGRGTKCLVTGGPERGLLSRRRRRNGVFVAAPWDELVDLLLQCVVDRGAFEPAARRRLSELMSELRRDPPAAGRAAERVQQELAPALTWCDLLEAVVQGQFSRLLERRRRLVRQMVLRSPAGTLRRMIAAAMARLAPARRMPQPTSSTVQVGAAALNGSDPRASGAGGPFRLGADALTRKQIRGSGLLLAGYSLSSGLKFGAELIVVRHLSTSQYGAWTYALAAVALLRGISALGLNRAIARFLPQHLERGEVRKFFGVLVFVAASVALSGVLVVAAFHAFPSSVATLAGMAADEPLNLLFVLVFMVPLETIDNVLLGVSAAFGDARTIFVRRFLLHPGLRFGVAAVLVIAQADATLLAYGYLLSALIGIAYYASSVLDQMRRHGLLKLDHIRGLRMPIREVVGYTAPAMAADWCAVLMVTAGPLLLGYFSDVNAVALYQVAVPVAALNMLVYQSFGMLFEPSASRLIARNDRPGLDRLYWQSAVWVTVLTFPLFAISFAAAEPLIVLLYGERYADAAPILSMLAVGLFVDSMAGFNSATLRVGGRLGWLMGVNVAGAVTIVALSVVLVPSLGALGAGLATAAGHVGYTVLKQVALRLGTGVAAFDGAHLAPYLTIALVTPGLLALRLLRPDATWILVSAVVLASIAVLLSARVSLSVSDTFPELGRSRLVKAILG